MSRPIDYDEFKWRLTHWYDKKGWAHDVDKTEFDLTEIDEAAGKTPTLDTVKHGHWEDREVIDEIESSTAIDQWQVAKCSVCRRYHTTPYMYSFTDYEYCPWCGAHMLDEVGNDETD